MSKFVSTTLLCGTLGALVGGMVFGALEWSDTSVYWIGGKDGGEWLVLALVVGLLFGGLFGALIGFVVSLINASSWAGVLIGLAAGLLVAMFIFITSSSSDEYVRTVGGLAIPSGAALGLISGVLVDRHRADK